jgi:hypothetical protein
MPVEYESFDGCDFDGDETVTWEWGNLKLVLEQDECYPKNPGQGTPAMVYLTNDEGEFSATFYCATDVGDVDGYPLTEKELAWLNKKADKVEEYVDKWWKLAEAKGR